MSRKEGTNMAATSKTMTLADLLKMRGKIDFNPAYQRDRVWSAAKQQILLAAVIMGTVPGAIALRNTGKKKYTYELMDGKQRLSTLFAFLDGELTLNAKGQAHLNRYGWKEDFTNKFFADLPEAVQKTVLNTNFPVIEYTCTDQQARQIFLDIQNGERVSQGEKLNAERSNARTAIMQFARNADLSNVKGVNETRFGVIHLLARLLWLEHEGELTTINNEAVAQLVREGVPKSSMAIIKMGEALDLTLKVVGALERKISTGIFMSLYWFISQRLQQPNGGVKGKHRHIARFLTDWLMRVNDPDQRSANLDEWRTERGRTNAGELQMRHRILDEEYTRYNGKLVVQPVAVLDDDGPDEGPEDVATTPDTNALIQQITASILQTLKDQGLTDEL